MKNVVILIIKINAFGRCFVSYSSVRKIGLKLHLNGSCCSPCPANGRMGAITARAIQGNAITFVINAEIQN